MRRLQREFHYIVKEGRLILRDQLPALNQVGSWAIPGYNKNHIASNCLTVNVLSVKSLFFIEYTISFQVAEEFKKLLHQQNSLLQRRPVRDLNHQNQVMSIAHLLL